MAFLITDSAVPLLMETVPACKVTYFTGTPAHDEVYSYLRFYFCGGALHFAFMSFDEAPLPTARMALCLQSADGGTCLVCSAAKADDAPGGACALTLCASGTNRVLRTFAAPATLLSTGSDEQGLFWCRSGVLPAQTLTQALGQRVQAGCVLTGNIFLYDTADPASYGAAFPVPARTPVPTDAGGGVFTIVPY